MFFAPLAVLGLLLVGGGVAMIRSARSPHRVPVAGRIVDRSWMTTPTRVTVEYPGPDGARLRARLSAGPIGGLRGPQVGDPVTVHVNPAHPQDVSLGAGGAATTYGWAFVAMGTLALLAFLRLAA
ncbi:DUF3592 domain-containing protein [Actinotalea solisilvae]|uniref:DUF3592 domain-containing protein n=1 Tax=Actinotalea solisilvae TaxID=2072922 RepID=UPI0018F1174C|nr:DUF3592 domain-containing protein [Actinotalea solisilvae]